MRLREKTGVKLDLVDVSILDFFVKFSGTHKMDTIFVDNKVAYKVDYNHFIREMPLLEINNKEVMARRFSKLVKAEVLFMIMKNGNIPHFGFGKNYIHLVADVEIESQDEGDPSTEESTASDSKVEAPPTEESTAYIYHNTNQSLPQNDDKIVGEKIAELLKKKNLDNEKKNYLREFYDKKNKSEGLSIREFYRFLSWLNERRPAWTMGITKIETIWYPKDFQIEGKEFISPLDRVEEKPEILSPEPPVDEIKDQKHREPEPDPEYIKLEQWLTNKLSEKPPENHVLGLSVAISFARNPATKYIGIKHLQKKQLPQLIPILEEYLATNSS
ncbi:MAG: hypothetical protein OHK0017_08030 [Patescibacteria group bacterium]